MNKLYEAIKKKKLSFAAVGRMVGYERSTISRHCNNFRKISAEAALRYNKFLGIPLSELRPDIFEKKENDNEKK